MNNQFFNFSLLGKEEHEARFYPKEFETRLAPLKSALGLSIASDCPYSQEVVNKFESRVCIFENGCWGWRGGKDSHNLGRFCIKKNKSITTARASFKIYRENIGDKGDFWIVRVSECPTAGCCNPLHLKKSDRHPLHLYSQTIDKQHGIHFGFQTRFQKGREALKGTESKSAKLTELQAVEIRIKRLRDKVIFRDLASQYQVSTRLIQKIVKGQAWHHLPTKLEDCIKFVELSRSKTLET